MTSPLRRRFRHARRVLGYGFLVLLILLATGVGALNQLLPLVERHPDKVAAWLSERLGEPVAFGSARGEWTRQGPRFTFAGLRIGEGERQLEVGQAELLFAVYSGLLPGEPLTALKVRDLSLTLEQGEDRRWRLAGLPFEPKPGVDPLDTLEALGELQVERARLQVRSPVLRAPLEMARVDLRLRVDGETVLAGLRAWADPATPPLSAVADLRRDDWSGELWAGGDDLVLQAWSALMADTGVVLAGRGKLDLWARIDNRRVMDVRSRAEFSPLAIGARRPWLPVGEGRLASPPVAYESASLLARWQAGDDGAWQAHVPRLQLHEPGRAEPRSLDGLWLAGGDTFALRAPRLDLVPVRQWASLSAHVPDGLRQWLHRAAPEGQLRQVRLQGREGDWQASAALDGIGWRPHAGQPGLQALSGHVALDQAGGVLQLAPGTATFEWPGRFRAPLEFQLQGLLGWWRDGGGWTLGASRLSLRGPDYGARLRAELAFQGDGSRPRIDLAAVVDTAPVSAAGKFWVQGKMPDKTIDWLDKALLEGEVRDGRISLAGDLDDWPFRDGEGRFDARARVAGARVHFSDEWPDAEAMEVDVGFDGPGMTLDGQAAIAGNPVDSLKGGIPDFRDPRLLLDVASATRGETLQALMLASPLNEQYGEHLRESSIAGLASVSLLLDLPLVARLGGRRIEGSLDLAQARLADPRWDIVFTEVSGRTRFSAGGFQTQDLQVLFDDQPGVFNLAVGNDTGDPALAARARLLGEFPVKDLLARHPPLAWLDPHVDGRGFWDIRVDVPATVAGQAAPASRLRVESDLAGVQLKLPAPLAKPADLGLPMRLDVPLPVSRGELQLRLGALARLRGRIDEQGRLTGALRLGEDGPLDLPDLGLVVLGQSATLDAAGWIGFAGSGGDGQAPEREGGGTVLRTVDLRVDQLDLMGSAFADTHVRLARGSDRTRVTFDGPQISGNIVVPFAGEATVEGRLERLHWPEKTLVAAPAADAKDGPAPAPEAGKATLAGDGDGTDEPAGQDPASLPPLDFQVRDLRMGSLVLGEASLRAHPVPAGLRIDSFSTRSEGYQLDATGDWRRAGEGATRSDFKVGFSARALGDLLGAFGLSGMIEDGPTTGRLEGGWAGSPGEFSLARFEGVLKVEVGEGALLEVEPGGGGRVLGLISLAEIPRRLTLDFKDFFNKGFGFNSMAGEFVFADGKASTDLLQINGPAAEIRVSGSTNLRSQQYDQRIEVLPKAGGVLPAIGAIAGGPVGAAVGAVAQAVLQKPLKEAARTVYRVTGDWTDPVVEVVEKGPPPAPPTPRQP
ncbi:YhdP family protein [Arenimonas sp.]|uniref:YhdP family protein n=1 Tax=Arenimonas sp. TaxID=1872635 RepID=UPI0035AFED61